MANYIADFETNNCEDDCRVWAWGIMDIDTQNWTWGTNIEGFFNYIISNSITGIIYFHNLKFDGDFILNYLLRKGYKYNKKADKKGYFSSLISGTGSFYSLKVNYGKCVSFYDSFKLLPQSVEKLGKMFGGEFFKRKIDYNKIRPTNHPLSYSEITYLKYDLVIVAKALKYFTSLGGTKSTIGANALYMYKKQKGKLFDKYFPAIDEGDIRKAYRGGFVLVNEKFKNMEVKAGYVYDVNSLYPYVMHEKLLPWGNPVHFEGQYIKNDTYPLYIQILRANFDLKPNHIPTIQLKNSFRFKDNEYIKSSNGEIVTLYLTNIDLKLFFEHYDVWEIEYISGYMFRGSTGLFKDYIDYWNKIKEDNNDNEVLRFSAKLYNNNLYGKFGTNPEATIKIPIGLDNGKILYKHETTHKKPVYLPVAIFVTSWGRDIIIRAAQQNYDIFCYADTDSLHVIGNVTGINIDDKKLGYFKKELEFNRAKYLRAKTYIEETDTQLKITCCGMPKGCYQYVTFDNFSYGSEYNGKLQNKKVANGTILYETTFKIRET